MNRVMLSSANEDFLQLLFHPDFPHRIARPPNLRSSIDLHLFLVIDPR